MLNTLNVNLNTDLKVTIVSEDWEVDVNNAIEEDSHLVGCLIILKGA